MENVNPFQFTFKKIMPTTEAKARQERLGKSKFAILHELDGNECVVERTEYVPGFLAQELHPIYVRFDSLEEETGATDMIMILQVAYKPIDNEGALHMITKTENWLTYAETTISEFFSIFGRRNSYDTLRKISLDEIIEKSEHTDTIRDDINTREDLYKHFNDNFFTKFGFEVVTIALREINYGPDSKDLFEDQEKIAKREREKKAQKILNEIENSKRETARLNNTKDWEVDKPILTGKADIQKGLIAAAGDAQNKANAGYFGSNPELTHAIFQAGDLKKDDLIVPMITANTFTEPTKKRNSDSNDKKGGDKNSKNKTGDDTANVADPDQKNED